MWAAIGCAATGLTASRASAEALLVIEVETGKVLLAENAAYPWYPASVTKLMTAYAVLRAVKDGRLTLETRCRSRRPRRPSSRSRWDFRPAPR